MYTSEETCCGVRKSLTMLIKSRVHLQVPALEIFPFAIYTFIIKKNNGGEVHKFFFPHCVCSDMEAPHPVLCCLHY